jgi:hypothetical protein
VKSVKRDILAAITFLVTGLVFAVAQMGDGAAPLLSQDGDCVMTETVLVDDVLRKTPTLEPVSRDS